ncbi:T9SS type A sorting domain-containing protein [Bizionia gelidisalsuginis]|uniref:T9SS type A sorting domain-containing protein n=1 Tax=Bizionia gelidisalsuginis TaxID=291188 RepID=A0ABY3MER9_9FLAO|nr:T9SS type A sorting domain-containing protein [Bizionia gelidisalsuginis]TYC18041.1 T9SS type A sorting domain-containing protein [Bizionia gelidisalsuginis]
MRITFLFLMSFIFSHTSIKAQNYPGGVTGAEVWYMGDWEDINNSEFVNSAQTDIKIKRCGEHFEKGLFNFNPSIFSEKLCLEYRAPLENSTGRNAFFVGEPYEQELSFSHLATFWRSDFIQNDSIIRNFIDLNNENVFSDRLYANYSSDKNANLNFYHTNNYNIDKKFKSYGQEGETSFFIGKPKVIILDENYEDSFFRGRFPEFLSFPRELSDNERNRVESYLALKYGLTLNNETSYLNSKNLIFWDKSNNDLFANRIFGFGKDLTSGLNQLQSESTHLKNHLISAIDEISETNMEKQTTINLDDNHFLVFGDNKGEPFFIKENSNRIAFWEKVWLAQRTGKNMDTSPIHFKLFLTSEVKAYLQSRPDNVLWLMQDKFIGNDEVSDFNNQNVEYYVGNVNLEEGFAYFTDIYFDSDFSIYDQFTFGSGPEMIVQAQVKGCKSDKLEVVLDITGGKPYYHIVVEYPDGTDEYDTSENSFTFLGEVGVTYHITVYDEQGVVSQVDITAQGWDFSLDLGPDQYLNASQTEIVLDASQGIEDPDATYAWYLDGILLNETGSSIIVTDMGTYEVIVNSGDLSCSVSDRIEVINRGFTASVSIIQGCGNEYNNGINISINGGVPPFTTVIQSNQSSTNYVHNNSILISDLANELYSITITDSEGANYMESIEFFIQNFELDLITQIEYMTNASIYYPGDFGYPNNQYNYPHISTGEDYTLDASLLISGQNVEYKWTINDILISEQPIISFSSDNGNYCTQVPYTSNFHPIVTVEVFDSASGCFLTESFSFKGYCPNNNYDIPQSLNEIKDLISLKTKVYPNPSEPNTTFSYQLIGSEQFDGTVEIFTVTGARLYSLEITGDSNYTLPFNLQSAGMYVIRTSSSLGVKIDKVIIE